jgi:seryl-tRNA synthetase
MVARPAPEIGRAILRRRIPKESLNGSGTDGLTEGEAEWREEKALLRAELQRERARADKELERANGEQEKAARERERAEGLRGRLRELKAEQSKGPRWKLFGG